MFVKRPVRKTKLMGGENLRRDVGSIPVVEVFNCLAIGFFSDRQILQPFRNAERCWRRQSNVELGGLEFLC